ncbi:MAG: protein kinase domain-containing protein, partial [Nannocystaceae bacterium]
MEHPHSSERDTCQLTPQDVELPSRLDELRDTVLSPPSGSPRADPLVAKQMRNRVFGRLFNKRERLKIGRYDVLDSLGHGGMGVVYSAYDDELDRKVAIKILIGDVDRDAELRFKREAQAMARLNHANVVTVHEVGE